MFYKTLKISFLTLVPALFASLTAPVLLSAQNSTAFVASANAKQVLINGYFEVNFTLKNANGTDFAPPSFKDFTILAGPSSSTSMQIINGVVSREMGFSYTLQPTKVGKFTIGSASIRANGKKMTSNTLTIEVIKGSPAGQSGPTPEGEAFLRLEPDKTEAYIGEQILLDFKLYTSVSIDGYDIPEEPEYQGFYAQELKRFASNTLQEVVNGKQYTTRILRRVALFPQQTGLMTIQPVRIQLAVVEESDRTGFFFNRNVKPVFFTTDALDIKVKPLPDGAPGNFSGAVGAYDFQASLNRNSATTDDAFSIMLLITGAGDVKRIQPPPLVLSDSFEVYAPKVVEEDMAENRGDVTAKKVIEYLVLPKYPGSYRIEPAFTFFNTETRQYATAKAGPFPLTVKQGSNSQRAHQPETTPTPHATDIRFIKTSASLRQQGRPFVSSPLFWGLTALPVLAFFGVFFFRRMQEKQGNVDISILKSKKAGKEAQKRLATAHKHLTATDSRAFYDEVSKASLGYVCDKLNIPLSQLTKDNVREKLQSLSVSTPLIEDFMKVIQTCEMALFAGMDNSPAMQSTYEKAIAVISGIEQEIG